MLPIFSYFGHKHYPREIADFLLNLLAVWPAFWSRIAEENLVIDGSGCCMCISRSQYRNRNGHAKALDHLCEMFVGMLKRALRAGGVSPQVIMQHSTNSVFMLRLLEGLKRILHLGKRSTTHSHSWSGSELEKIELYLREQQVFDYTPGRKLASGTVDNLLQQADSSAFEYLSKFLSNRSEPMSESDFEPLPESHRLDDDEFDLAYMIVNDNEIDCEMEVIEEKKE
jgi:hypothetical protein